MPNDSELSTAIERAAPGVLAAVERPVLSADAGEFMGRAPHWMLRAPPAWLPLLMVRPRQPVSH